MSGSRLSRFPLQVAPMQETHAAVTFSRSNSVQAERANVVLHGTPRSVRPCACILSLRLGEQTAAWRLEPRGRAIRMEFGTISSNRQRRATHERLPNPTMPKPASNEKNLLQQMQSQPGGRPENGHNRRCPMLNRSRRNQRGPNRQSNQQFHQRDCAGTAGTRESKRATPH